MLRRIWALVVVTLSQALLEQLATDSRRVVSGWRSLVLLRRATFSLAPRERRWDLLPNNTDDLKSVFRQMARRGEIKPIHGFRQIFEVTVPYARQGFVDEREVLFELNPYAALSHFSALVFHGLTEEQPKGITATVSADVTGSLYPIGTIPRDWEGIEQPRGRTPTHILGRPVTWIRVNPEGFFGVQEYQPLGYSMRYTTMERTLIDGLRNPAICGGIGNVLRAWVRAQDMIDLDLLVHQVERLNITVMRQRIGYVLDQLELSHPGVEKWRTCAPRGGSSRLVGSAPFSSSYDERWNLSLNAPVNVLQEHAM
jgi:predicted transcriptional regulator of viral defense system